ncbi:hypothetical protein CALVIDRAFT_56364 [Calocera viscosa TUFC12733]|uniref:Uncharacterized protein n=1 Tax=Calocera viscosa (strain TUFC12733) TaxID=1330018 RepID=A0A167NXJ6_CALVF|nr:hypothetical protein CALVIDRAFT_56364 [Calocera viscosa TUFC12733]
MHANGEGNRAPSNYLPAKSGDQMNDTDESVAGYESVKKATATTRHEGEPNLGTRTYARVVDSLLLKGAIVGDRALVRTDSQAQARLRVCFYLAPNYLVSDFSGGQYAYEGWLRTLNALFRLVVHLANRNVLELETLMAARTAHWQLSDLALSFHIGDIIDSLYQAGAMLAEVEKMQSSVAAQSHPTAPKPADSTTSPSVQPPAPRPPPTVRFSEDVLAHLSRVRAAHGGLIPSSPQMQLSLRHWFGLALDYLIRDYMSGIPDGGLGWAHGLLALIFVISIMHKGGVLELDTVAFAGAAVKNCVAWARFRQIKSLTPRLQLAVSKLLEVYDADDSTRYKGATVPVNLAVKLDYA